MTSPDTRKEDAVADANVSDIHSLPRILDRALWVLENSKLEGDEYLSAAEVARRLTNVHKIATDANGVRMGFKRAPRGLVHAKKQEGGITYAIMEEGERYLSSLGEPRVVLIEPDKAYSSRRKVEDFFEGCSGLIRICDPHVNTRTLDPLTAVPKGSEIRLLTNNVYDDARVLKEIEAYEKEYSLLEVRVSRDNLHDRYLILEDKIWSLGHSLNGLGKREAFIISLGQDMRSQMVVLFDRRWATSPILKQA